MRIRLKHQTPPITLLDTPDFRLSPSLAPAGSLRYPLDEVSHIKGSCRMDFTTAVGAFISSESHLE